MQPPNARVPVASAFFQVAVNLEDGTVHVYRHRSRAAAALQNGTHEPALDAAQLMKVAQRKGPQPLAGRRGGRHFQVVAERAGDRFLAQDRKVAQAVAADEKARGQAQNEVLDGDATAALLDGEGLEVSHQPQPLGQLQDEAQTRERRDRRGSGRELDSPEAVCDLHLESAPFWGKRLLVVTLSIPELERFFYLFRTSDSLSSLTLPVDLG